MAQAVVDPTELRKFAHHLKHFNTELREQIAALYGQLLALGDTWRDTEHDKFIQEFEQTMNAFKGFVEVADQHIPLLLHKADRIDEYLNQR